MAEERRPFLPSLLPPSPPLFFFLTVFFLLSGGNGKSSGIEYDGKCWNSRDPGSFFWEVWLDPSRKGHQHLVRLWGWGSRGVSESAAALGGPLCLQGHAGGRWGLWQAGFRSRRVLNSRTKFGEIIGRL